MMDAKERYRTDPVFNRVVDSLRAMIRDHQITPSELREALMLAAYCEELENPSPVYFRMAGLHTILESDLTARSIRCRRCKTPGHVAQRDSVDPDLAAGRNCRIAIGQEIGPFSLPK